MVRFATENERAGCQTLAFMAYRSHAQSRVISSNILSHVVHSEQRCQRFGCLWKYGQHDGSTVATIHRFIRPGPCPAMYTFCVHAAAGMWRSAIDSTAAPEAKTHRCCRHTATPTSLVLLPTPHTMAEGMRCTCFCALIAKHQATATKVVTMPHATHGTPACAVWMCRDSTLQAPDERAVRINDSHTKRALNQQADKIQ